MTIKEFAGIRSFHDGLSVSEYTNMIPMDNSCIDRVGEKLIAAAVSNNEQVLQTFIDSQKNIYIATTSSVRCYKYKGNGTWEEQLLVAAWAPRFVYIEGQASNITFCESTTKPSQVFMCDGKYVYYWNTVQLVPAYVITNIRTQFPSCDYDKRVEAFTVNLLPLGDFEGFNHNNPNNLYETRMDSDTGFRYGWWPQLYDGSWAPLAMNYTGKLWSVSTITWYCNRLVAVTKETNTVRLSVIRPDRWIIPTKGDNNEWLPIQIFQDDEQGIARYNFIPHAYISTASSALLQDAVAFAGQLYFLNDTSIEIWTNTFNEDAPIQQNTLSTIHFGGRSPCIVADQMYLICKDNWHNDFIAAVNQSGQIQRISNDEIEKRIAGKAAIIRPLSVRDNSFVVIYNGDDYYAADLRKGLSVTRTNKWWTYDNRYLKDHTFAVWSIATIDGLQFDVGNHGELIRQDPTTRLHVDGSTVLRFIRGCFTQLPVRGIVREVELVCDTGISFTPERGKLYIRVSFDRGLSFGPYLYRSMGKPGKNDRQIIWRNCGSGNSFLVEFGTSDNLRFQLYEINLQIG